MLAFASLLPATAKSGPGRPASGATHVVSGAQLGALLPVKPAAKRLKRQQQTQEYASHVNFQSQKDGHDRAWTRILFVWQCLRNQLLPISRVLQDAQQSQNSAMLEENMLRRNADTTIERYLHVLEAFLECAADLDLSLVEMGAGPFVDVLLNMGSDPRTRIHKTNALKALRWACNVWVLPWPAHHSLTKALEASADAHF